MPASDIDNQQSFGSATADASPIDLSYTVSAVESNLALCVFARLQTVGGNLSGVSATYNGVAMTTGYGTADQAGSFFLFAYLLSPASGTHTISISYTTTSANAAYVVSAFTVTNTTGLRDSDTATGSSATSLSMPALSGVVASDMCVMGVGLRNGTGDQDITFGSGQTQIHDLHINAGSGFFADLGTSYELGETTLTAAWTNSSVAHSAWCGAFINATGGSGFWAFF